MKLVKLILCLLVLTGTAFAADVITTLGNFNTRVRERVRIQSTVMISDSTIRWASREAILYTSVTVGGLETNYRFVTAANDPYYRLPDTVVRVLYSSIQGGAGSSFPLKAWAPQYYDIFDLDKFVDAQENQVPVAFIHWADTIQLLPPPARVDTVLLRCFVEHPSIPNDTNTILLRPAYTEAALEWACSIVFGELQLWDEAATCRSRFKEMKADLEAVYSRRFDLPIKAEQ